ncbi:unnamed protein product [Cylicostephanus goldi]|uniref:Peptidase M3A/M3B catalytic domain-containing protein n=1 Tax=Cylicostephanus goldi TaxID=71465 RepID=A0A3P6SLM0_CYLGO|nr:unnamed protein product [Cylicostephanus goldi]
MDHGETFRSIYIKLKTLSMSTRCPQDFSEVPSILMEYFFNDLSVMQSILRSPSGECIEVEDAACMIASRFAFSSLEIMQQASYALFDLELHGPDAPRLIRENRITTTDLFHSIVTKSARKIPLFNTDSITWCNTEPSTIHILSQDLLQA